MKGTLSFAVLFFVSSFVAVQCFDPVHNSTIWDRLLKKYVSPGEISGISLNEVNYSGLAQDPDFPIWVDSLKDANINNLTRDEVYSFYANVYNTLAINTIIQNPCRKDIFGSCGPIKSIRDVGTILPYKAVWDKPAGTVGGKEWTLQQIEDYLITPTPYKEDPRLHSAIVCASVSCPNLHIGAFTPEDIDAQFNATWNDFLSNTKKGMSIDRSSNTVTFTKIFDWYGQQFVDFFPSDGSVIRFVLLYLSTNDTNYQWLQENQSKVTIQFFDYDWNANTNGPIPCDSSSRPCYPLWALLVTLGGILIVVLIVVSVILIKRRLSRRDSYRRVPITD